MNENEIVPFLSVLNGHDIDGDFLTYVIVNEPLHGTS